MGFSAVASAHTDRGLLSGGLLILSFSALGGSSNDGLLLLEGGGHNLAGDTCNAKKNPVSK